MPLRNRLSLVRQLESAILGLFGLLWTTNLAGCVIDPEAKYGCPATQCDQRDTIAVKYGAPDPIDTLVAKYGSPVPVDTITVKYGVPDPILDPIARYGTPMPVDTITAWYGSPGIGPTN